MDYDKTSIKYTGYQNNYCIEAEVSNDVIKKPGRDSIALANTTSVCKILLSIPIQFISLAKTFRSDKLDLPRSVAALDKLKGRNVLNNSLYHAATSLIMLVTLTFSPQCFGEAIVIMGNENKPPKVYIEQGEAKGILVDIMKYIDDRIPQAFEFELMPWKRAFEIARNGEGGIIGLSKNSARLKIFDYSEAMFLDTIILVVLKGNEFQFNGIQDLKGMVVGARRGSSYGDDFEQAKNTIFKIDVDNSGKQRLQKLLSGRIDVALVGPGRAGLNNAIKQSELLSARRGEFVMLPTPFKRDPNYLGFARSMKMGPLLKKINKVIRKGKQSGDIQKIIDSHLMKTSSTIDSNATKNLP